MAEGIPLTPSDGRYGLRPATGLLFPGGQAKGVRWVDLMVGDWAPQRAGAINGIPVLRNFGFQWLNQITANDYNGWQDSYAASQYKWQGQPETTYPGPKNMSGQNNAAPPGAFVAGHSLLEVGNTLYDPSYGTTTAVAQGNLLASIGNAFYGSPGFYGFGLRFTLGQNGPYAFAVRPKPGVNGNFITATAFPV